MRRLGMASIAFALSGAFYLLLIDTADLPELGVLVAAALLAALAFEASRELGFAEASIRLTWLARTWRVLIRLPAQVALVSWEALAQLVTRKPARGSFRTVPFGGQADSSREAGRRAVAEAIGSVTPNTIVIGVDPDRRLLLVHQLHHQGGPEELDVLGLG